MPSLLDIAPPELSAETIDIRGTPLKVSGIGADHWAALYSRFPELRAVVTGKGNAADHPVEQFNAQVALIATGLGSHGDPEIERGIIDRLTTAEQLVLVQAIVRLSLPGYVMSPLLKAADAGAAAPSGEAPATK
jgi:hypothetical protein